MSIVLTLDDVTVMDELCLILMFLEVKCSQTIHLETRTNEKKSNLVKVYDSRVNLSANRQLCMFPGTSTTVDKYFNIRGTAGLVKNT